jgi:hypothetical protein
MKTFVAALAAAVAVIALAPLEASAQGRGYKKQPQKHTGTRFYGRAHSVDHNGLCKRDTGTPSSQLNFRNKCDVEEYWNRVFENGRRR